MLKSIILASSSPRRKQLLEWAEIPFDIVVQPTDECFPAGLTCEDAAMHIALQKALAVKEDLEDARTIVAADTIVVLNDEIIGKPKDRQDAIHILSRLQGNIHKVITGVAIIKGKKQVVFADITEVAFHDLTTAQIAFYVDKY